MKVVLDTGCIDFFLHDTKYQYFKDKIREHEEIKGEIVTITIINYAERKAGLEKFARNKKYLQILEFLKIVCDNLFYISKETAEIYATLYHKIKDDSSSNVSDDERKRMQNDLWVASLCIEHSCKLYTDDKHFFKIKKIDNKLDFEYIPKE